MKKNLTVWNLFSVVILAAFALFIMYPIFLILYRSVIHGDTGVLTLQNFAHFFAKKFYWGTMVNSLKVTVVSTAASDVYKRQRGYRCSGGRASSPSS